MEYVFTLKYLLPPEESDMDALVQRLGAQGVTDAVVGIGQPGRLALELSRAAATAQKALQSALTDVQQAVPSAQLWEAGPDFVGLSDIAARVGVTRQNLHKLTQAHPHSFPPALHEGSTPTWHLADVLLWLRNFQDYALAPEAIELAQAIKQLNLLNQVARHRFIVGDFKALALTQKYDARRKRHVLMLASGTELAFGVAAPST